MTSEGTSVSLCGWQLVCGPEARGASQRPGWPLDSSGGTALTWLPRAPAQPVPAKRLLAWASWLGPHQGPVRRRCHHAHFADEETEARRGCYVDSNPGPDAGA